MKKKLLIILPLLVIFNIANIIAEEPPIASGGWYWDSGINLNGKWFYEVSESYNEQDGWALVLGRKLHYWLYDTYTYHNGYGKSIIDKYVPIWIESMGYVIDFDHIRHVSPNNDLASSVKALMKQRGCDVSVALITDSQYPYVVINNFDKDKGIYWTDIYPLIR